MGSRVAIWYFGIAFNIGTIIAWGYIIHHQLKQFNEIKTVEYLKKILLALGVLGFVSNIIPLIFDVYRIVHPVHMNVLQVIYGINDYFLRAILVVLIYLIYKY